MDEGRLELDDDGRVLGLDVDGRVVDDGPTAPLDLEDPGASTALAASRVDAWVSGSLASWAARHARPVAAVTACAVVAALGAAWWTHRPPPPPAPPAVVATDAGPQSGGLDGARFSASGDLEVTYAVRAGDPDRPYDVVALEGPGLTGGQVVAAASTPARSAGGMPERVVATAHVRCDDPAIATSRQADYALAVRPTDSAASTPVQDVPLGPSTTRLDVALRAHCLATSVPRDVSVVEARLGAAAGSSVVPLRLVLRSSGTLPVTVETERLDQGSVAVDRSQPAQLDAAHSALVETRVLVHDCGAAPDVTSLADSAHPVLPRAYQDPSAVPAITLRLTLGDQSTLASYPLPFDLRSWQRALSTDVCAGRPSVTGSLDAVTGTRAPDGTWAVDATLRVRTSGIGVSVGRESFAGPAWGSGSTLVTGGAAAPGSDWQLDPVQLDGGAGHLAVRFTGTSCAGGAPPDRLPLRVVDALQTSYPFDLPLDPGPLRDALAAACAGFTSGS